MTERSRIVWQVGAMCIHVSGSEGYLELEEAMIPR